MDLISEVITRPLKIIPDDRGWLMEVLRSDWERVSRRRRDG